jgi:hypothetical protein
MTLEEIGAQREGEHRGGIRQKYVLSEQGRLLLLRHYDGTTEKIDWLAKQLGMPRQIIRRWGSQLGLARQKEPRWTPEEIAYLENNLSRVSTKAMAERLGRTQTAVKLKAKRLHLNKTQEGYTMRGLCLGLGCDHHKVQRWMERGWLKGKRRQTERDRDIWYFSDKAIREFVKNHPQEVDPRRCDWLWLVDLLVGGLGALE